MFPRETIKSSVSSDISLPQQNLSRFIRERCMNVTESELRMGISYQDVKSLLYEQVSLEMSGIGLD
jgi:hypothetical protein